MLSQEIAEILLTKQAVKISLDPPFTFASGIKSPIYCDNRILISHPDAREKVLAGFQKIIAQQNLEFDVIGGTATAAIPWAAFLAQTLNKPMVYIRPKPKEHGAGKRVEGTMPEGSRVLIVEDLISTGGSSIRSAEACEHEFSATVVAVLAIFTYELAKAAQNFAKAELPLFTLSNFSTLVAGLNIEATQKKTVLAWSKDPERWRI